MQGLIDDENYEAVNQIFHGQQPQLENEVFDFKTIEVKVFQYLMLFSIVFLQFNKCKQYLALSSKMNIVIELMHDSFIAATPFLIFYFI